MIKGKDPEPDGQKHADPGPQHCSWLLKKPLALQREHLNYIYSITVFMIFVTYVRFFYKLDCINVTIFVLQLLLCTGTCAL